MFDSVSHQEWSKFYIALGLHFPWLKQTRNFMYWQTGSSRVNHVASYRANNAIKHGWWQCMQMRIRRDERKYGANGLEDASYWYTMCRPILCTQCALQTGTNWWKDFFQARLFYGRMKHDWSPRFGQFAQVSSASRKIIGENNVLLKTLRILLIAE